MKAVLFLVLASLGLSAHGGILSGPLVNPANGHFYYLLSQNTWSNAEVEAVSHGGHLATIRNAFSLRSAMVPKHGRLDEDLQFPIRDGEVVHLFDSDRQKYVPYPFEDG